MKQRINATRMELMRVRKRLALAQRGHKLLKDKLEGLIKELTDRLADYKALRLRVDKAWPRIFGRFAMAGAAGSSSAVETAIAQARPKVDVTTSLERIMGIAITHAEAKITAPGGAYSLMQTSPAMDEALRELREFLPDLIRLAALEQAVRALCAEVEKTRRRANALEYVLVPDLSEARKIITSRLEEMARSDASRLMKVKQMLLEREESAAGA